MTRDEAEAIYKAKASALLALFQSDSISFAEWSHRHSDNCAEWRGNLWKALHAEEGAASLCASGKHA